MSCPPDTDVYATKTLAPRSPRLAHVQHFSDMQGFFCARKPVPACGRPASQIGSGGWALCLLARLAAGAHRPEVLWMVLQRTFHVPTPTRPHASHKPPHTPSTFVSAKYSCKPRTARLQTDQVEDAPAPPIRKLHSSSTSRAHARKMILVSTAARREHSRPLPWRAAQSARWSSQSCLRYRSEGPSPNAHWLDLPPCRTKLLLWN